jgi:thiol:disulfide interchange protein DsbA
VDGPAFAAAFDSPRVDERLQQALALAREYGIDATPSLVVAGRYKTNPAMAGSTLFAVVDELVGEAACHTRCDGAFR